MTTRPIRDYDFARACYRYGWCIPTRCHMTRDEHRAAAAALREVADTEPVRVSGMWVAWEVEL